MTPDAAALCQEWSAYVAHTIQGDGRVIDRGADHISTSEGQAYALVRAGWCGDRASFDRVLGWTLANLQGGDPARLPAWKWGRREDGSWGVLDETPAADADQWLAWALLSASDRWAEPAYALRAGLLLPRIWDLETGVVGSRRLLLPGPWALGHNPLEVNPSYWLPFAWRRFAEADPAHDWTGLIDDAYAQLRDCRSASGLPPDWCWLDPIDGHVVMPPEGREASRAFGYEAFRVGWTLAAELSWHQERRARALLEPFARLVDDWVVRRPIPAVIEPDGRARETWGFVGLYGALLPAWGSVRPALAEAVYREEIAGRAPVQDYYANNWVWMGVALWVGLAR